MNARNSAVEIQFRLHCSPGARVGEARPEVPGSGHGRLPRVTQVVALAIQFQEMIQKCEARDYADLARLGCLTRERMSQIMELIWLAPDIQREILEFPPRGATRFPISEVAVRKIAAHLAWHDQRESWQQLKNNAHL